MQALQNGPYSGYMAILAVAILISFIYALLTRGKQALLAAFAGTSLAVGMGLFVSHAAYIVLNMPMHIAKRYLFYPIGFVPQGYLLGHLIFGVLFAFLLSFVEPSDGEVVALTIMIQVSAIFPPPYSYVVSVLLLLLFWPRSMWSRLGGCIVFSVSLVLYNVKWAPLMGLPHKVALGGSILACLLALFVVYRGETNEF